MIFPQKNTSNKQIVAFECWRVNVFFCYIGSMRFLWRFCFLGSGKNESIENDGKIEIDIAKGFSCAERKGSGETSQQRVGKLSDFVHLVILL